MALGGAVSVGSRVVEGLVLCVLLAVVLSDTVPLSRTDAVRDRVRVRERVREGDHVRVGLAVTVGVKVAASEVARGLRVRVTVGLGDGETLRVQEMDWDTVPDAVRVATKVVGMGLGDAVMQPDAVREAVAQPLGVTLIVRVAQAVA